MKALPAETNFGSAITYKSLNKNCAIEANLINGKKAGICQIQATASGKEGMWSALDQQIAIKVIK
jgi:hypothetical protein